MDGPERIVCGRHPVKAALGTGRVIRLLVAEGSNRDLIAKARKRSVPAEHVSAAALERMSGGAAHQGIVAECLPAMGASRGWRSSIAGVPAPLIVVLDQVQDPRNLGACLRSAAAFGADALVHPRRNSASLTPAARKAAAGGEEHVAVDEAANIARELRSMKEHGLRIVGAAAGEGEDVRGMDLSGPLALVLGGEAKGLRDLTRKECDELATIPLPGAEAVSSLNVSVACGILLAEATRCRYPEELRRAE